MKLKSAAKAASFQSKHSSIINPKIHSFDPSWGMTVEKYLTSLLSVLKPLCFYKHRELHMRSKTLRSWLNDSPGSGCCCFRQQWSAVFCRVPTLVEQSAGVVLRCHVTRGWDPCHKHLPIHYVFDSELTLGDAVHSEVFYCCQTLLRTPTLNSITSRGVANLS